MVVIETTIHVVPSGRTMVATTTVSFKVIPVMLRIRLRGSDREHTCGCQQRAGHYGRKSLAHDLT
jgi:hypothetical protein